LRPAAKRYRCLATPLSGTLELVLPDRKSKVVNVNVIVNPYIDEVAISDYVASELELMLLDFKKGLWRLADDPPQTLRKSE